MTKQELRNLRRESIAYTLRYTKALSEIKAIVRDNEFAALS